ncbi:MULTISPECIES: tetratricopeptide repeat protein [unclassified Virgibacillus]|uniref:tetratricopeptide repeat protein n=1 Tax=unclassified Virgibacillus TaxID=2620237 RepID=UPI0024DED337|nr:tetratricopeptide repeat protein [Virgibacillus sp. LDC-1]
MNLIEEASRLFENEQTEEALQLINNYIPNLDDEEKYTIAQLFMQWGFLQNALELLSVLREKYPNESNIKLELADIYIELDEDEHAIDLLHQIELEDEAYIPSLMLLADLYQVQGLYEVAEQKLLQAKQLAPQEEVIDFALGELLFSIGEYKRAIVYYERMNQEEMVHVSINERLAEAYAATGEYEKALTLYAKLDSENADTLFKYGTTAHQAGRNDIAIHAWKKVMELDPLYTSVYLLLATAYEEENLIKEGYETAKKGIEKDEFNKELFFLAGSLAHQLNDNDTSEQLVREAIALDPDYKEAVLFLIEFFKEKEEYESIIELIQEIQQLGASDPLYEWELARAYVEMEFFDDALNSYSEAYNNLNEDSDFLKEYGYFLIEEGRTEQAISVLRMYLKEQPLDTETEEYVHRLKDA